METILRKIRADLRLSMDGAVAASMRQRGVSFRMNFGVNIQRIKEISLRYEPSETLAEALWKEDVRELKILATMLFPPHEMTKETANRWVQEIVNQEIREQACKNLFQEMPISNILSKEWSTHPDEKIRVTGYWLFTRLCIARDVKVTQVKAEALLRRAVEDLRGDSILLLQSALNALRFYGRTSEPRAQWVLQELSMFNSSGNAREKEMYEQLNYEFSSLDSFGDA